MKIVVHSGTARAALAAVGAGLTAGKGAAVGIRSLAEVEGVAPADLLVASLPPAEVHTLGVARGYFEPIDRQDLAMAMRFRIARLVVSERPRVLVVPLPDAALWCDTEQRLGDLHRWLLDFSDDLTAVLHMAHPAEALADAFVAQVAAGRTTGLADEQRVGGDPAGWWQAAGELRAACRVPPQPAGQLGRASIKNCINGPQPASFRIRVSWN